MPHIRQKQYSANEDMMNNFRYRLVLLAGLGLIDKETEDPRVPDAKQAEIFRLTPRGFQLLSEYRKNDRYSELLEPVKEILHAFLLRE